MTALKDKIAIITGASSGIGRAAATLFAREGAKLVITARRSAELNELAAAIEADSGTAIAVAGDVADEAHAQHLVTVTNERFGGLDIAFNNAGIVGAMKPLHEMSSAEWRETLDVNLTSAFLCAKYQLPAMIARGGGSLIFTSSFVGYATGFPGMPAYAAAKAGLVGLVRSIATEFGAQRIRANALLPGGTDTPIAVWDAPGADPNLRSFIEGLHALKRVARPEEIAKAALFLASDASSFMTGAAMLVDGGISVTRG
ncbi:MAG: short-chain dehydrogenase [Rhizobiales bacterium 65-9]|nr:SDR family oxidoreductase [Hyphomicrobiales bacterium]OJY37889.1 MAG: short-chain dehydrogenase [Rhizobiales bacterium 65-9]